MKQNGAGVRRHLVGRLARMMRRLRHKAADEQGAAAIEMAFILPFLLVLLLGSVEMFLMSMASRKAARLTNTVGDLVAQAPGTLTKAAIADYYKAARHILGKLPKSNMGLTIYVYEKDSRGRPRLRWRHHLGSTSCQSKPPTLNATQKAAMQDGNDLVLTFGCYRYPIQIGKMVFGNRTFTLNSQVILRPRQQLTLACKDC